jgi:hypothetical protein
VKRTLASGASPDNQGTVTFGSRFFRRLALFFAAFVLALPAPVQAASSSLLLGFASSFEGLFEGPAGMPELSWSFSLEGTPPVVVLKAQGQGISFEVELHPNDDFSSARWRLRKAHASLAALQPLIAAQVPELRGFVFSGQAVVNGEGTCTTAGLTGWAQIKISGGTVDYAAKKLHLEGVELDLRLVDLAARRSAKSQLLHLRSGKYNLVDLGPADIVFSFSGSTLSVEQAKLSVLGGGLTASPFAFDIERPVFSVQAHAEGIQLHLILPLLPPLFTEARGQLGGTVSIHYDSRGFAVERGLLGLSKTAHAEVRLKSSPGLISTHLPKSVVTHYPGFKRLETGESLLKAERFEVTLTPAGDEKGRGGSVHIEGGPLDPALRAPVVLDINLFGPLDALINISTRVPQSQGK